MAANLSITAADVVAVKVIEQITAPADEAITPGQAVRFNTSTGYLTKANGTNAGEARCCGLALTEATQAGDVITALRKGVIDIGDALSALTYDDDVFLSDTDATLADTAGSVTLIVGTVVPAWVASTPDKLLRLNL